MSGDEWVIIRVVTDGSGAPTVSVVGSVIKGDNAETRARAEAQRLNRTARQQLMEVFIARKVGDDENGAEGL